MAPRSSSGRRRWSRQLALMSAAVAIVALVGAVVYIVTITESVSKLATAAAAVETELHEVDAALLRGAIAPADVDLEEVVEDAGEMGEAFEALAAGLGEDDEFGSVFVTVRSDTVEALTELGAGNRVDPAIWDGSYHALDELVDEVISDLNAREESLRRWRQFVEFASLLLSVVIVGVATRFARSVNAGEKTLEDKDRFLASVSHELRTPLTAVVGLAHIIGTENDLDRETRQELAVTIYRQSLELANMVEDLLIAGRSEISEVSVVTEPVDLLDAVNESMAAVPDAGFSEPRVVGPAEPGALPTAWADPLRVRQIIRNLMSNAVRYGGAGRWVEITRGPGVVTVTVADDGPPVPFETPDDMFEPYRRSEQRNIAGSVGIGLAVARDLANRMGGSLEFVRSDGYNTFVLTLPGIDGHSRSRASAVAA